MIVLVFVVINVLVSILNENFCRVKAQNIMVHNDYEMVDYMVRQLKRVIGFESWPGMSGMRRLHHSFSQSVSQSVSQSLGLLPPTFLHPFMYAGSTKKLTKSTSKKDQKSEVCATPPELRKFRYKEMTADAAKADDKSGYKNMTSTMAATDQTTLPQHLLDVERYF